MGYDDPSLKEFAGYLTAREPGRRERADAWATAIGLQAVDGLRPSAYLYEVAKRHIEGDITAGKARDLVDDYYETKSGRALPDDIKEADKVSARIVEVVNDEGFDLSPAYFSALHGLIFEDVLKGAGGFREVNIRKREWVLKDDSVTYGDWKAIGASLDYAFDREKDYSYVRKSRRQVIAHLCRFVAAIWKIHPFREGNTRTTAVFAIKYLKELGYAVTDNMFKDNSWYFRNALVRACYENPPKGVARAWEPLERFFENLLLGKGHELKSRYLLVGLNGVSPLGTSVRYVHRSSQCYAGIFTPEGKKTMAANFREFLDRKNYPILFHCIGGADRTGALAYVLNGVLGVSRQELETDWESTFYPNIPDQCHPNEPDFWCRESHFNDGFSKYGDANTTWNDRIVLYLKDCGITDAEIETFREIML